MKPSLLAWNWILLLLLGLSSCGTVMAFLGTCFWFDLPGESPAPYPWTAGLVFSALTAITFLFCLRDPHHRRAAFASFGICALMTGPLYIFNAWHLAQISPVSSPWIAPSLPFHLGLLCLGGSAGLYYWWRYRSIPIEDQGLLPVLLFRGLFVILLLIPAMANRLAIDSLAFFTSLPTNADAVHNNEAALTQLISGSMESTIEDICNSMILCIGIGAIILSHWALAPALRIGRFPTATPSFPNRKDLIPLLFLVVGGLLFPVISSTAYAALENIYRNASSSVPAGHQPVDGSWLGFFAIIALVSVIFLTGSWLVLMRIRNATHLRSVFCLMILIASGLLSGLSIYYAPHAMKVVGWLALILCVAQCIEFFHPKRRMAWTSSAFAAPGEMALSFALQGSVMLAVLASAWVAIALELAFISVMAIKYLMEWGNALKSLHGMAPVEKIAPEFAPSMASITYLLGPVFLAICLCLGVATVLIFSLVYSGIQGCRKRFQHEASSGQPALPVPDAFSERHLGDVQA
jgi:hypothetical protein